ncbi:MAG TPA: amino acid ABC transporter permease [Afifellaceae bacterium]|nr:amino acid ABC transporter permease [Afifellaceae bacterium]
MAGIHAHADLAFVRREMLAPLPPPVRQRGAIGWMRANLFADWLNALLTILALWVLWVTIPPIVDFAFINAVWSGDGRRVCATEEQGGIQPNGWFGACWAYVGAYLQTFIYGRYPVAERWRVDLVFLLFAGGLAPMLTPWLPYKRENLIYMAVVFPVLALVLLSGGNFRYTPFTNVARGNLGFAIEFLFASAVVVGASVGVSRLTGGDLRKAARSAATIMAAIGAVLLLLGADFGLPSVRTARWGGLLVTLVIAVTGIAASLPIGIALALGRRSSMPAVRLVCVIFIEFWRGVPLITVLFMSSVMLPLFVPEGVTFDKLLRALVGVALFASAYMAEVVRGGLQAIPRGQYEAGDSLGLRYWQKMNLIILPQALTLVIPGIVNTFIGLFKDTTLVLIIGLFDFLGMIHSSLSDPTWASPVQPITGYTFAAFVYFWFCFGMSRYSIYTERRLAAGQRRGGDQ